MDTTQLIQQFRVPHGRRIRLADHDPAWAGPTDIPEKQRKKFAEHELSQDVSQLAAAQELLYAADSWSILVIFQALDAAGKDGTIRHVMSGVNPQGVQVFSFKHPSAEELDHNFLWRSMKALPERGRIGIFNRSHYEEVLITRVHPELIAAQRIPSAKVDARFWRERFQDINAFEHHLSRNGTRIIKFFLNVSRREQRQRLLQRLEDPNKHWKFNANDLAERRYWKQYQRAYEEMLNHTSTSFAPWYVIPADHKWVTRALVARILVHTIGELDLRYPPVTSRLRAEITAARQQLAGKPSDKKS